MNGAAVALFAVAAFSLFWLRTPLESWLGTSAIKARSAQERKLVLQTMIAIAALASLSVGALLWTGKLGLIAIGAVSALALAIQMGVKKLGRKGRMPAQLIGAVGLTSTAAGAYYVATGRLDRTAIALWLANWIFACDQIHFVQVRIHSSRAFTFRDKARQGLPFLLSQMALIGVLIPACRFGLFPTAAVLAFIPVLLRGMLWFVSKPRPLDVHKLGFTELGHSLLFGTLFCAAFFL
jgi:hypothetical protein